MGADVSLYWHDYETFGADPRRDRPAQFAGVRTDEDFNPVGEPQIFYCRPADDYLPAPEACLITGITPQRCLAEGLAEAEFAARVHAELANPRTCALGYNTLRFDDEITRHLFYRNLFEPYAREWQNGNSRWDLIDVARMTFALRPEGIEWPRREDGTPGFRLEELTAANGIAHEGAHDALADVWATIGLAQLLRSHQPRLFDFVWKNRGKREAAALLALGEGKPLLHVSEKFPARHGCLAVVLALAAHPVNANGVIVYDLSVDPQPLLELSAEEIRQRVFAAQADLPDGIARVPLKMVHLNRCPALAPLKTLRAPDAERLQIDLDRCLIHAERLGKQPELARKIREVFAASAPENGVRDDPDFMLYRGGFFSDADRQRLERIRHLPPEQLAALAVSFDDARLPEMLFRYRARNWPETLNSAEQERWEQFRRQRIFAGEGAGLTLDGYRKKLENLNRQYTQDVRALSILAELEEYGRMLARDI
jgi:exodeoxyribonuclease-1